MDFADDLPEESDKSLDQMRKHRYRILFTTRGRYENQMSLEPRKQKPAEIYYSAKDLLTEAET